MYFIKNRVKPILDKVRTEYKKEPNIDIIDVYDETLIPDWKTYLYYYELL